MPIAGVDIFWPGLVLIGFSVGVIGGFFGMGGAWMVTPGLNILGFPMAFAIGTDIAHIAGKSMISTMRHSKFGNVDYKLGFIMLIGTMVGIEMGAQIVMALERIGKVGPVVRWVYVVFLALIAFLVFYDYYKAVKSRGGKSDDPSHTGATGGAGKLQRVIRNRLLVVVQHQGIARTNLYTKAAADAIVEIDFNIPQDSALTP